MLAHPAFEILDIDRHGAPEFIRGDVASGDHARHGLIVAARAFGGGFEGNGGAHHPTFVVTVLTEPLRSVSLISLVFHTTNSRRWP